jgi:hypothetical protein
VIDCHVVPSLEPAQYLWSPVAWRLQGVPAPAGPGWSSCRGSRAPGPRRVQGRSDQGGSRSPWHGRAGTLSSPTSAPTTRRSRRRSASRWPTAGGRCAPDPTAAGTTASRAADSPPRGPVRVPTTTDTRTTTASTANVLWQRARLGGARRPARVPVDRPRARTVQGTGCCSTLTCLPCLVETSCR